MERERELGTVRREQTQHVAGPEAPGGEAGGDAVDPDGELRVGERPAGRGIDERGLVTPRRRLPQYETVQREVRDRDVAMRALEDHGPLRCRISALRCRISALLR